MPHHVPLRRSYLLLAFVAAVIGLASSAVTADFFVLGLERLESDASARQALIAVGLLMITTELVAFGVAAFLPRRTLRGLRVLLVLCGSLLLAFEGTTIYMTQAALMRASETASDATAGRVSDLRAGIDAQRAAAKALRDGGTLQAASKNDWTRHLGALDLRAALETERSIEPMAAELARLQSSVKPTMGEIFGARGMLAYAVARALLVSVMGVVMLSAAGALVRAAREIGEIEPGNEPTININKSVKAPSVNLHLVPKIAPIPPAETPISFSENESSFSKNEGENGADTDMGEARYQRVLAAVRTGVIRPAVLGVRSIEKVGAAGATAILARMESEGVTRRNGRTWCLGATHAHS